MQNPKTSLPAHPKHDQPALVHPVQSLPCHHGPWQIKQSKIAYQDPWLTVRRDEVLRPDGTPGSYAMVKLKPGVCVVAIDDEQNVHLTEEFHYAVGRITLEGVSGGIEPEHDAEETRTKELEEELGIRARTMESLGVYRSVYGQRGFADRIVCRERFNVWRFESRVNRADHSYYNEPA